MEPLVGIGLYTPAEAERLVGVGAAKIARWLRGHTVKGRNYPALWRPQIEKINEKLYLGFLDLMEIRVAASLMSYGVSAQMVRSAIECARDLFGLEHPLSTRQFKTDGRKVFINLADGALDVSDIEKLLDVRDKQYVFASIVNPSLYGIDFDKMGSPMQWWPNGHEGQIVVDPTKSFGQPIDVITHVPTAILATAAKFRGVSETAKDYDAPLASVRRAILFEADLDRRRAA